MLFRFFLISAFMLGMFFLIAYLFAFDNSPSRWDFLAGKREHR